MGKKEDMKKMLDLAMKLSPEGVQEFVRQMETAVFIQKVERERYQKNKELTRGFK